MIITKKSRKGVLAPTSRPGRPARYPSPPDLRVGSGPATLRSAFRPGRRGCGCGCGCRGRTWGGRAGGRSPLSLADTHTQASRQRTCAGCAPVNPQYIYIYIYIYNEYIFVNVICIYVCITLLRLVFWFNRHAVWVAAASNPSSICSSNEVLLKATRDSGDSATRPTLMSSSRNRRRSSSSSSGSLLLLLILLLQL